MHELPEDVRHVCARLVALLGTGFGLDDVVSLVEWMRRKPLRIEMLPLSPTISGLTLALQDVDLIYLRPSLDPLRKKLTTYHECSHLLLNHVATLPMTYAQFHAATERDRGLTHAPTNAYDDVKELAAEGLAMMILAAEGGTSPFTQAYYGKE